jgi:hypothetical protein
MTPAPQMETVCEFSGGPGSPLMIEMESNDQNRKPLEFTSQLKGILFDLLGLNAKPSPHTPVQISWYKQKNYYFLVLPNDKGDVGGINELFGNNTFGPDKQFAEDGYKALAKYDGKDVSGVIKISEADGYITNKDPIFAKLRMWNDANFDGIGQKEELISLEDMGIELIDLNADADFKETDKYGNQTTLKSVVRTKDGKLHLMFDVWFRYLPGSSR